MKKLFAILAVASLSASAYAADSKGTEFKFGGDMSQMFNWNDNTNFAATGSYYPVGSHESHWLQKNNFHVTGMTSDKMMAYINLYNANIWGSSTYNAGSPYSSTLAGAPNYTAAGAFTAPGMNNTFAITEAWMWWKASDMFSIKTGRQAVSMGSGYVVSKNENNPFPYFFDSVMGRLSWDFLDVDFGGAKLADMGAGNSALGFTGLTDAEITVYAINLGFKSLPEVFKKLDIFALQINSDQGFPATAALPGMNNSITNGLSNGSMNLLNYGLYTKLEFMMFDLGVNYVGQSGKQLKGTTTADTTFSGNAIDGELGVNFPEFMKARLSVEYDMTSGDDPTTANTNEGYQPLFYDVDKYSVANIWGLGNLTNLKIALTLQPGEDTTVGVDYQMASRTQSKAGAAPTTLGTNFGNYFTVPSVAASATTTNTALGSVIDLWAKHNYGHGLSAMAGVSLISLGNYYQTTGASANPGSATAVSLGATYNF